ncbi:MAG: PHP domain-containing protein [Proteocatella sp.]
MKCIAEYHCHTIYSDGKSTMEENVKFAIEMGLEKIGISDHGYKHKGFGVKYKDYPKMKSEIEALREKYPQIKILLGVEANILDDKGNIDVDDYIRKYVDYVIAGYHFGSMPSNLRGLENHIRNFIKPLKPKEIDYNTRALVNAMKKNNIFILTHPGDKGLVYIEEVAKAAEDTKTVLEINAHHNNLSIEQIEIAKNYDVLFSVGSDAHHYTHMKMIEEAILRAEEAGLDGSRIINVR